MTAKDEARQRDDYICQVWACGKPNIHVHHIIYKGQEGPDELWNLICLCAEHHESVHDGKISILDILKKIKYRKPFHWSKAYNKLTGEIDESETTRS